MGRRGGRGAADGGRHRGGRLEVAGDRVLVQMATLRAVQAADGRLALGALWGFAAEPEPALAAAAAAGFAAVHPFVTSVSPALVERAHAMGLPSTSGPSMPPRTCGAMVAAGADTVITDRLPEALAAAR